MEPRDYSERLAGVGRAAGLADVGVAHVGAWTWSRGTLEERRHEGRAGSMAFTYRNPPRSTEPGRILPGARSLVVGAWRYSAGEPAPPSPSATAARVARYAAQDSHAALRAGLDAVAATLKADGHRAVVIADDNALVDREAAFRAGLGFYGKNSNLLLRDGGGSWVVLGAVVTTAHLATLRPPAPEECGTCRRCLDSCPTGAIVAPGVVDARRCLSWVLQAPGTIPVELRAAVGDRIYGCDDCQEVCPPSRRAPGEVHAAPDATGPWIDAAAWLAMDDADLIAAAGRWYVAGHDPAILRRNLLVVLGNAGATGDPAGFAAVESHLDHPDPVVAEHARWALQNVTAPAALQHDGAP